MIIDNCPDCGVALGRKHKDGCDWNAVRIAAGRRWGVLGSRAREIVMPWSWGAT